MSSRGLPRAEGTHQAARGEAGGPVSLHGPLAAGVASLLVVTTIGHGWFEAPGPLASALNLVWLSGVILWGAVGVLRHAEVLAHMLGEPLGTLILTLSAVAIEVALILSVMLVGEADPTLTRDTMLAVLMIVLNGLVGLALLLGGLRHQQQSYNLQGASAFLVVLLPLAICALVLPRYTTSIAEPALSAAQGAAFGALTLLLYGVFLAIQTRRHRSFFEEPDAQPEDAPRRASSAPVAPVSRALLYHSASLVLTLLPVALLAHHLAVVVDSGIHELKAPPGLAGVLLATLILAPEGLSALKAAWGNHLQRSVNILLGSALSTIGLTVPAVLLAGLFTGAEIHLGLDPENTILLVVTLMVSTLTFGGSRTDVLKGAVHLVMFAVFVMLIVMP
jgi:Ca2+:H+ antiporter